MKPVTFIGAYERDNFGDLLLCSESARYALEEGLGFKASSPFKADMTEAFGLEVERYADTFSDNIGPCWIVGGELGGISLREAAVISDRPWTSSKLPSYAAPYLPVLQDEQCRSAPLVLNSVGLAGIKKHRGAALGYVMTAINSALRISVRERASSEVLRRLGVAHSMAPDIVHGIVDSPELSSPKPNNSVLLQFKKSWLRGYGIPLAASLLAEVPFLRASSIQIFVAGTARGHDSLNGSQVLAETLRTKYGMSAIVLGLSKPYDKVEAIRDASLWIGTSLHGLIISTAFGVPAVALRLPKLTTYAESWNLVSPSDVALDELEDAIAFTMSGSAKQQHKSRGNELADLARQSARASAHILSDNIDSVPLGALVQPSRMRVTAASVFPMIRLGMDSVLK